MKKKTILRRFNYTLSAMFNAIATHQEIAFQLIFFAWPRLLGTITNPRRVIGNYSGKFILGTELCLTRIRVELTT